jgi:hypothetical protein
MPVRPERFFWLYVSETDGARAAALDGENRNFAQSWPATSCALHCETCVSDQGSSPRVWLYRLATDDQAIATQFNKQLSQHAQALLVGAGAGLQIKRRTNLPQPLVYPRPDLWPKTDVGLHSANDQYNGMLVSYSYHEGGYYHVPYLQLSGLIDLCSAVQKIWAAVACGCRGGAPCLCEGVGCFHCFQSGCPDCDGTGWKDFVSWAKDGYQVDYSSGVPLARGVGPGRHRGTQETPNEVVDRLFREINAAIADPG